MTKQEILLNVFNKLRVTGAIRNRQDFAEKIGYNYTCTSAALNGVQRYLNDRFFTRILMAFPQVNETYLRTGTGEIFTVDPETGEVYEPKSTGIMPMGTPRPAGDNAERAGQVERTIELITQQQELTRRQQEQTDRALEQVDKLIEIIRTMSGTTMGNEE